MSETKVIFTQSYSGKNKHGKYPTHVLDVISKQQADLLDFHGMQKKYADILKPNGANFQYWINWLDVNDFKNGDYVNTGRKRYKSINVPSPTKLP